ncbi:MAG: RluA family pseudouridine synthase [Planctomycetes bacterium]|nr:RluA family pseudouridine synthase [Planctomycetota bacterium]
MKVESPILYEDADILAIDKPEGVLSHPNPGGKRGCCAFTGRYDMRDRRFDHGGRSLWLIHRLDKDTSGVLLAARSTDAAARLRKLFTGQDVRKYYIALVAGVPGRPEADWRDHIETRRETGRVRSHVRSTFPPNAGLHYRLLQAVPRPPAALLSIQILTGRTHQIRVQCASRNHPILGDRVYGDFQANRKFRRLAGLNRMFLHAERIVLPHPRTGRAIVIEAPLPAVLGEVLDRIRTP